MIPARWAFERNLLRSVRWWVLCLCSYSTFCGNNQSWSNCAVQKSSPSHAGKFQQQTDEIKYSRFNINYTHNYRLFSKALSCYYGRVFQSSGFNRRSQQVGADLDSGLSQASSHDSGPWSEWQQMRLTGTQGSLWATGRSWGLMMSSGVYCLRQNHTSAFSNQDWIMVQ